LASRINESTKARRISMFARVHIVKVPKDKAEAFSKRANEATWPWAKSQKGYKGYLTLRNQEAEEDIVISLWDTEANMLASEKASQYTQATDKTRQAAVGWSIISTKRYVVGIKD
jgi:heme-degrading monooxygenase HmoA